MSGRARVLIVDPLHPVAVEQLRGEFEVTVRLGPGEEELRGLVAGADVLVMRSGVRLSAETIAAAPSLRLVARAGTGLDNIDLEAAERAGVRVFNVPSQAASSVAEHAIALALAVTRRIPLADSQVRRNEWRKAELVGDELRGGTIGIVGLGAIGSLIARLALGFQMRVLASVARPSERRRRDLAHEQIELVGLELLLAESAVVCVAAPLTARTRGLIGARELALMAESAYVVNVARGGVVDEAELYAALAGGRLAGAALDVVAAEGEANRLGELDNVVLTPHIGAMTEQAQRRIGETVVASIRTALAGGRVANQVC